MSENFITDRAKKAARIYYTVMPENENQFPPSIIDKAERESVTLFENPVVRKEMVELGLFKNVNGSMVITEKGIEVAKAEIEASRNYLRRNRKQKHEPRQSYRDPNPVEQDKPVNYLKMVMAMDSSKLMSLAIYCLQAIHSRDEYDRAHNRQYGNECRLTKVLEGAMHGGTETVIPKAKDRNGKPLTDETRVIFGHEYDSDTFGQVLHKILMDNGSINCEYIPLPKD